MYLFPDKASHRAVSVPELLASRDERQARQNAWLAGYRAPLISFTVVAPGPVKDSELTRRIFNHGVSALHMLAKRSGWVIREQAALVTCSGPEAFFAINRPAREIKQVTIQLEQQHLLGRLWDIDVLTADGRILSRRDFSLTERRCLLCSHSAAECGRARTHTLTELLICMEDLLDDADRNAQYGG